MARMSDRGDGVCVCTGGFARVVKRADNARDRCRENVK
jgi:hypothetical protein